MIRKMASLFKFKKNRIYDGIKKKVEKVKVDQNKNREPDEEKYDMRKVHPYAKQYVERFGFWIGKNGSKHRKSMCNRAFRRKKSI